MSSAPAGQRSWKCPECGSEVMLSVTQLDPIACDACLNKMKSGGTSHSSSGAMGIWSSLPETTKLAAVVVALLAGLLIGYLSGKSMVPASRTDGPYRETARVPEAREKSSSSNDSTPDDRTDENAEDRPDPPGPGYKWVQGRKHKDGTRGAGHWAKDPRYKGDESETAK